MTTRKSTLRNRRNDRGQGMTEYVIIVGLVGILLIGAVKAFQTALGETYKAAAEKVETNITNEINKK